MVGLVVGFLGEEELVVMTSLPRFLSHFWAQAQCQRHGISNSLNFWIYLEILNYKHKQ
jgi:hypothetical protein